MNAGRQALREELEGFASALEVFSDPLVDELAGLRLMRSALTERRDAIAAKLAELEQTRLRVLVEGTGDALPARFVAELLGALADAVLAVGRHVAKEHEVVVDAAVIEEALQLHLTEVSANGELVVLLERPPGALETQLVLPRTGQLVIEAVFDELLNLLVVADEEHSDHDDARAPQRETALDGLRRLARLVASSSVRLTVATEPVTREPRSVSLDRSAAQRLDASLRI